MAAHVDQGRSHRMTRGFEWLLGFGVEQINLDFMV